MSTSTPTSGGTTTSFSKTPQAKDDVWQYDEASGSYIYLGATLSLDVMGNDLGGKAKSLYSIESGLDPTADLLVRDTVGYEYSSKGAKIQIVGGKVEYTINQALYDQINALGDGQELIDTFTYAIQLGNGTLSWATATVRFTGVNDPPTLDLDFSGTGTGYTTTFTDTGPAVKIVDTDVKIVDVDDANIESATVTLTNAKSGDALTISGTLPLGIIATINTTVSGVITITLTGSASLADYQTALQQVLFSTSANPDTTDRNITVVVSDGQANSNTAHVTIDVVDATIPTGGTPDLVAASDSGISATDNNTNDTSPTFTVALGATVAAGDKVELLFDGSSLAHPVVHTITAADVTAGMVTLAVAAGDLGADGNKSISAKFTDASNNSSTTAALVIDLDTDADVGNDLTLTIAATDLITNASEASSVSFTVSGLDADATGTVTFTSSNGGTPVVVVVGANGSYTADLSGLNDGTVTSVLNISDDAGNVASANGANIDLDTTAPTVATVTMSDSALKIGDTSTVIITFSEAVTAFDNTDVAVQNGILSALTTGDGGITWTGTFTPTSNIEDTTNVVTVGAFYTDVAGNAGSGATSANYTIDTKAPTVGVNIVATSLTDGTPSSTVTFTFDEAVSDFVVGDITATNGSISGFTQIDATHYEATFTATNGASGSGSVSVAAGTYADVAGNSGALGSDTVGIDRENPTLTTVALQNPATSPTNANSLTFRVTFSEAVSNVGTTDFVVTGGTTASVGSVSLVSPGVYDVTVSGGNLNGFNGPVGVALSGSATINDSVGNVLTNFATTGSSASYSLDNVGPGLTITQNAALGGIGSSITLTFQFTESVTNFTALDISTNRGNISNFAAVDGDTYTATFTRTANGNASVSVAANSYTDLAGNNGSAASLANLPAGIAGEPINLALTADSTHSPITVTISSLPEGWLFNGGTQLADGSWTITTMDVSSLTVTTPSDYVGASVLDVTMQWTNADGSTATVYVADNVEAFAPGSPIIAWSGDDTLTGSSGADTFVVSQPIGTNVFHSFDVAADQVDLIGFDGIATFDDVLAHLSEDADGNAVLTLDDGQSITFKGVSAASLTADNFVYNVAPVIDNAGTMTLGDGAMMPLTGTINNTGTIALESAGDTTLLQIIQHGASLEGGGQVTLSDSDSNVISGSLPGVTLTNVDNTISGAGQIGAGQMGLINEAMIVATGSHALVIDTGANTIVNSGTLQATGEGGLFIESALDNSGLLWANGGNISINGDVSGSGAARIDGTAKLDFGAAADVDITLDANAVGTIEIDHAALFYGSIAGLNDNDRIEITDLTYSAEMVVLYQQNAEGTGGTLSVTDGTHTANIELVGQYSSAGFSLAADDVLGTVITYHQI